MKKFIIYTFITSILIQVSMVSCDIAAKTNTVTTVDKPTNPIKIELLTDQVSQGLYKITLNDSTTILIYRGVESCTMIQLK